MLAWVAGGMALARYYSRQDVTFLVLGTALLGTGLLDGYHAVVTSAFFAKYLPSELDSLIPWSWVASRFFLATLAALGLLAWRHERKGKVRELPLYVGVALLTGISFAFFAFTPLPRAYYPEFLAHRPEELIPGALFGLALLGYLRKGSWRTDPFEHWLVVALIINLVAQTAFMPFSGQLFDWSFDAAHLLKIVSYATLLVGLYSSMFISFRSLDREVVERRKAELLLRESEQRHRSVVDNILDGMVIIDKTGLITFINPAVTQIFGYSADELIGNNVSVLMPNPNRDKHDSYLQNYCSSGRATVVGISRDVIGLRKDGSEFHLSLSLSQFEADGELRFTGLVRDITAAKEAEQKLQRYLVDLESARARTEIQANELMAQAEDLAEAKNRAEEATIAKSRFLASMSHEIRTPMNGVLGMTHLLLDTEMSDNQRDFGETIRSSGEALLALINDILDFSKIEAGKMQIEPIPFDLYVAVSEVAGLLARLPGDKPVELLIRCAPEAPRFLVGDSGRIRQILLNLLGNALKFTDKGHVILTVEGVEETPEEATVRISIHDTGAGIEPAAQAKLFEAFTQADASTTRRFGGTGLGLAICRKLVILMGGEIGLESEPGIGSTFWFTLRLPKCEALPGAEMRNDDVEGVRVLVVDDLAISRSVIEERLNGLGMVATGVSSGKEALARLQAARQAGKPFHVAVLDHKMPELDGEALARMIKSDPLLGETRLVLMTSISQRKNITRFEAAGFSGFLVKPFLPDTLGGIVAATWNGGEAISKLVTPHSIARKATSGGNAEQDKPARDCRVLLAEDNIVNQKVGASMLTKLGCRVDVAANGKEAVEMWQSLPYDAVFMDCEMPEMDGYEATRAIRKSEGPTQHTPVVAMTANAMAGDRERCLESGMDDYVSKPIDPKALEAALDRMLVA